MYVFCIQMSINLNSLYIIDILFLILALDYKDGIISSDVSGLKAAFPPLNQTFVVS